MSPTPCVRLRSGSEPMKSILFPSVLLLVALHGSEAEALSDRGSRREVGDAQPADGDVAWNSNVSVPCGQHDEPAWFGAVRDFPTCGLNIPETRIGLDPAAADVNGDGILEYFEFDEYFGVGTLTADGAATPSRVVISRSKSRLNNGVTEVTRAPLLSTAPLSAFLLQAANARNASGGFAFWRDVDGDHDLDLVISWADYNSNPPRDGAVWIENIGFQRNATLQGDLNGDGRVSGQDLGILIGNWSP